MRARNATGRASEFLNDQTTPAMLSNVDRFASRACRNLPPLYEPFRLPVNPLRPACSLTNPIARHAWVIVAYGVGNCSFNTPGNAHLVTIRRLADGFEKQIAQHWIASALEL